MVSALQNPNRILTSLNNARSLLAPPTSTTAALVPSTSVQQHADSLRPTTLTLEQDPVLELLSNSELLDSLRAHPLVPANASILRFVQWVQNAHPNSEQLRNAKFHLIRDLMLTQRNWVSDSLQMAGAVARTLGGALMTWNSLSMEWNGANQQAFKQAGLHLNSEYQSWFSRMGNLIRGNTESFKIQGEEAHQNDAALSLVRDLARAELRQTSANLNPNEYDYYQNLLANEIPEVSGAQQLADTLRSHSILFARDGSEALTGLYGALSAVGASGIAQIFFKNNFKRTVFSSAMQGFLQVALQTSSRGGLASMRSQEFALQATQAFLTGAAGGVTGSLVNAGFGRLLRNANLTMENKAGEQVFRWVTARFFQRGTAFSVDVGTEVKVDAYLSPFLSGRRDVHNRLGMRGEQVETTDVWNYVVNAVGEAAGDVTTHGYKHFGNSMAHYASAPVQTYGPQVVNGARQLVQMVKNGLGENSLGMELDFAGAATLPADQVVMMNASLESQLSSANFSFLQNYFESELDDTSIQKIANLFSEEELRELLENLERFPCDLIDKGKLDEKYFNKSFLRSLPEIYSNAQSCSLSRLEVHEIIIAVLNTFDSKSLRGEIIPMVRHLNWLVPFNQALKMLKGKNLSQNYGKENLIILIQENRRNIAYQLFTVLPHALILGWSWEQTRIIFHKAINQTTYTIDNCFTNLSNLLKVLYTTEGIDIYTAFKAVDEMLKFELYNSYFTKIGTAITNNVNSQNNTSNDILREVIEISGQFNPEQSRLFYQALDNILIKHGVR